MVKLKKSVARQVEEARGRVGGGGLGTRTERHDPGERNQVGAAGNQCKIVIHAQLQTWVEGRR